MKYYLSTKIMSNYHINAWDNYKSYNVSYFFSCLVQSLWKHEKNEQQVCYREQNCQ